jgi:hypothetical protein
MGRVRDAQKRSALEKEQQAAQKSIEKMGTQVKEATPKNLTIVFPLFNRTILC